MSVAIATAKSCLSSPATLRIFDIKDALKYRLLYRAIAPWFGQFMLFEILSTTHLKMQLPLSKGEKSKNEFAAAASVPAVTPVREDPGGGIIGGSGCMVRSQSLNSPLVGNQVRPLTISSFGILGPQDSTLEMEKTKREPDLACFARLCFISSTFQCQILRPYPVFGFK